MGRYIYSLVRCVPDPRTGEFVTVGAIAGDASTGDWSIRQIENERRVRKLAGANELGIVHSFMARVGEDVDAQNELWEADSDGGEVLTEQWLRTMHHDLRNVVQLSAPLPIVSETAEEALDVVFRSMIIDPVSQERNYVSRQRLFYGLRTAYVNSVPASYLKERVNLYVGGHLNTKVDFAIGGNSTYQLAQTWSFQVEEISQASTQVKAWGYALRNLRDGESARVVSSAGEVSEIDGPNVDLRIVVAPPRTPAQEDVYEEAKDIFSELRGSITYLDEVGAVADRARELVPVG